MISKKMEELGKKSSVIREIFEYGKKRKAELGEDKVFDFSLGNPSIPAPQKFTETLRSLIDSSCPTALHGYTSAPGDMGVREAIAADISSRFGASASATDIYMTCGAAASLTITLHALINEGDEVVLLAPYFPEYRVFCEKAGARVKVVYCREPDFLPSREKLAAAITEKTKAIIINSPNNPTGVIIPTEKMLEIAEVLKNKAKEYGTDIYIIADEPYRELSYEMEVPYIPNLYDNTVVCYSYSKSLSLPGERIGYIFVSPKAAAASDLFAAVCGAGRSLGFVCAPSLMQYAVRECIGLTADVEEYRQNRDLLYSALCDMGFSAIHPDGAFYLFLKAPNGNAEDFCEKAKKYELLLVPGDSFGGEGYVRISYCVSREQIERSLPTFRKLAKDCMGEK
ncbi:MAG: pyridoxal phosphate-dependent aminotransferase [Clostridia bacterium]|nr:pyridoxal phosphate-dependent aminotransferase [Clostridia bacterium]